MKISLSIFVFVFLTATASLAQTSNLRQKKIPAVGIVYLDSLNIISETIAIENADTTCYAFDGGSHLLRWKKNIGFDSVLISYRVFSSLISVTYRNNAGTNALNNISKARTNKITATKTRSDKASLDYSGVFGRSVSMGNTQNATMNSQLSLQINGMIADSIVVQANITDNNMLVQPYGYTQQLNEFDRIQLQFSRKNRQLNIGDIDLLSQASPYLRFQKRIQGFSFKEINKNNSLQLSAAIAKGKYTRNVFQGTEGNQGPYRLTGGNHELYFIVLAGSEKIYLNGSLLTRGEDADYVIDYNSAEIRFTAKQMITKDSRIQAEFEYADRNYLNSILYAEHTSQISNRLQIRAAVYSNSDAKNAPLQSPLDNKQRNFLNQLGDDIENAFYKHAVPDSFQTTLIMYAYRDTVVNGVHDSVYVYSTDRNNAKYRLCFSEVGEKKGNYVYERNHANGNVYKWVVPVNGQPQGNFEPAQFLVTPKKQQVAAASFSYAPDSVTTVHADIAFSKNDVNTFSKTASDNNIGTAFRIGGERTFRVSPHTLLMTAGIELEMINSSFASPERIRDVEFLRLWGMPLTKTNAEEQLVKTMLKFANDRSDYLSYQYTNYRTKGGYIGNQHSIEQSLVYKHWRLRSRFLQTAYGSDAGNGSYRKPNVQLTRSIGFLRANAGIDYQYERSVTGMANKISAGSFSTQYINFFLRSDSSQQNRWDLSYTVGKNELPVNGKLVSADESRSYGAGFSLREKKQQSGSFHFIYRTLKTFGVAEHTDNSFMGRTDYAMEIFKGVLKTQIVFESGSGKEPSRNLSYFEVPAGRGEYAWFDYNNDGIQQLNEFEKALFADQAKFVRIYLPSNDYIKIDQAQFSYGFTVDPSLLKTKGLMKNIADKIFFRSSMQTNTKRKDGEGFVSPFSSGVNDSSVVLSCTGANHVLSFNRKSNVWSAEISDIRSVNKILLSYGPEQRSLRTLLFSERFRFASAYMIELMQKIIRQNAIVPAFTNSSYAIKAQSLETRLNYDIAASFRSRLSFERVIKKNAPAYGGELAVFNNLTADMKWNVAEKITLSGLCSYRNIEYAGKPGSAIGYTMLDGLLPGKNYLWNISFTKRIFKSIETSVQYEGRRSSTAKTVHTGTASVRAVL